MTMPLAPGAAAPGPIRSPREERREKIRAGLSPASVASQAAVLGVCTLAMVALLAVGGSWGWAVAAPLALAVGIGIGLAAGDVVRPWLLTFRTIPLALVVVMVLFTLVVVAAPYSEDGPFGVVILVGIVVLGLDWHWAERLRPMVFLAGLVVVAAVAPGEPWAMALVVVWLLAATGALSLIEQDRRRARPPIQPLSHAPTRPAVRRNDLASMVIMAAALAGLAALILSTPSCNPNLGSPGSEFSEVGSEGSGGGDFDSSATRYVPDPDGNFLVPDDGTGRPGDGPLIPNFENPPELGPDGEATVTSRDGSTLTYRENPDGSLEVLVEEPDGSSQTWEFRDRSDGLTRIDQYDEDGTLDRTYYYDPDGIVVDGTSSGSAPPAPEPPDQASEPDADRDINWGLIAVVAVAIIAVTALVLWLLNRPAKPPVDPTVPQWAERLVRSIEATGAERGLARASGQSIVSYTQALRDGPLPDQQILGIGELVSQALFSHQPPSELAGEEAGRQLEAMRAVYPAQKRSSRFSRSGTAQ